MSTNEESVVAHEKEKKKESKLYIFLPGIAYGGSFFLK